MAWSDDSKTLFLANEEGIMSGVRIDASDLARPRISGTSSEGNFLWAVAQRQGMLVFYPSLGDYLQRVDRSTFKTIWTKRLGGESHSLATDGSRIFVALEGKPAALVVIDGTGTEIVRVPESDGWWKVYSTVYDETTQRLYIGAGNNTGFPGGIYIYDVAASVPVLKGKIPGPSWDIAARGQTVWRQRGHTLESWSVSQPSAPRLVGSWEAPTELMRGSPVRAQLGHMAANRTGTRLYVSYRTVSLPQGMQTLDWHAGFMVFDVAGSTPVRLIRQGWETPNGLWVQPTTVALSPNESVLAVSYLDFGVRLFGVTGDAITNYGMVATTGEAHDVYVDDIGMLHVFANDNIQTINPMTGEHTGVFVGVGGDGGWRAFKDGTIVLPSNRNGHSRYVLRIQNGAIALVTALGNPDLGGTWDELFEAPYLYSSTDRGLAIQRVGDFDAATKKYPMTPIGTVDLGSALIAHTKIGHIVWGLGPSVGVVAIDVSRPSAPRVVFNDRFNFGVNGNHAGIVAARGRVYAGAGDQGVIIYDAATFARVGAISGLNANYLDRIGDDFLLVSNYWYPKVMEGMVVYDLRRSPNAPQQLLVFPGDKPNANFRSRVIRDRVYRVPLYGVDVLEIR